jgi:hypothetical protein
MNKSFKGWSLRDKFLGVQAIVTKGGIAHFEVAGLGSARRAQVFRRLSNGDVLEEEIRPRWEPTDKWENREVSWSRGSMLNLEDEHGEAKKTVHQRAMQAIDQAPEELQERLRQLFYNI